MQSPPTWINYFSSVLLEFGMTHCETNNSVFSLHSPSNMGIYLVVYIDDIISNHDPMAFPNSVALSHSISRQKLGSI